MKAEEERQGCIYALTNMVNGKRYVGQTVRRPDIRFGVHIRTAYTLHDDRPLYRAIRKYGLAKFSAEIVWRGPVSKLDAAEKRFIRKLNTFHDNGWGYNLTTGGVKYRPSAATIRKLKRSIKASFADGSRAKRMSEFLKAYYADSGARSLLSARLKEAWKRPEVRARHKLSSAAEKRRNESVRLAYERSDVKARHRKAAQASWDNDPDRRIRLSAALKEANKRDPSIAERRAAKLRGRKLPPEICATRGHISKTMWANPEKRAKLIEGLRRGAARRWADPQARARHSVALTEAWEKPVNRTKFEKAQRRRRARERKEASLVA